MDALTAAQGMTPEQHQITVLKRYFELGEIAKNALREIGIGVTGQDLTDTVALAIAEIISLRKQVA